MKWRLHGIVEPFTGLMLNMLYMSKLSKWRRKTKVTGYNDWYQGTWDYNRREKLYDELISREKVGSLPIDYFEFGVAGGYSFRWWLAHNNHPDSRFFGFDTFEGLPEDFGPFAIGTMAAALDSLNITDPRARFYKGLFQDTLNPFLDQYANGRRKLIHMDADIFICAQDWDKGWEKNFTVSTPQIKNGSATASVTLPSGEIDKITINLTLIKTAAGWRINKVACAN